MLVMYSCYAGAKHTAHGDAKARMHKPKANEKTSPAMASPDGVDATALHHLLTPSIAEVKVNMEVLPLQLLCECLRDPCR